MLYFYLFAHYKKMPY